MSEKLYNYIIPSDESLTDLERISIEDDITSKGALIYEEDVEEIKKIYGKDIAEPVIKNADEPALEKVEKPDEIHDIKDNIVILKDDIDIDRFIQEIPKKKQLDLKSLLKYLDDLFEKLPESTVKSFANSEYFDLYMKVLNEMGI